MTDREKDMMERYIYEVIRRVPFEQREGIRMELTELITDMVEESQTPIEEVLTKLGDPAEFAKQYRDDKNYLISPEYYDNYVWVMKIVCICVAASSVISAVVQGIMGERLAYGILFGFVENVIVSGIGAFGLVTLVFAILERQKIKVDIRKAKEWTIENLGAEHVYEKIMWTPKQLSPVPHKKALISRGETAAGIIFLVIFAGLLIFAPQLFGAYVFEKNEFVKSIPIFNLEYWHVILPVWILAIGISFIDEMIKLVTGCYCKIVMISNVITGGLSILLAVILLKVLPLLNTGFVSEAGRQFGMRFSAKGDLMAYWGSGFFTNVLLGLICLIIFLEMGMTIYKTIRYGTDM